MLDKDFFKLLDQSKIEYAKYLESGESDALAEAGELLWECVKADLVHVTSMKTDNVNALMRAVAPMGEIYNQLFYHSYHFHSWYVGGVPNDFALEKKLYLETVKSLETLKRNRENSKRTKKQVTENMVVVI